MERIIQFIKSIFEKSERSKFREEVLNERIDFTNVVSSSLLAKRLYDELKVKAHPDRFQNPEMIAKATELFKLINQNKGNYEKLCMLKERVHNELQV